MQYIVEDIPPLEESTIETKVIQENKYIPAVEDTWTNCKKDDDKCKKAEREADRKGVPVVIDENGFYKLFVKTDRSYKSP